MRRRGLSIAAVAAAMVAACGGGQATAPPPSDVPVSVQGGPDVSAHDGTDGDEHEGHAIVLPDAAPPADGAARDAGRAPMIDAAPPADAQAAPAKPAPPTAPTMPKLIHADAGPGTEHPVTDAGVPRPQPF